MLTEDEKKRIEASVRRIHSGESEEAIQAKISRRIGVVSAAINVLGLPRNQVLETFIDQYIGIARVSNMHAETFNRIDALAAKAFGDSGTQINSFHDDLYLRTHRKPNFYYTPINDTPVYLKNLNESIISAPNVEERAIKSCIETFGIPEKYFGNVPSAILKGAQFGYSGSVLDDFKKWYYGNVHNRPRTRRRFLRRILSVNWQEFHVVWMLPDGKTSTGKNVLARNMAHACFKMESKFGVSPIYCSVKNLK